MTKKKFVFVLGATANLDFAVANVICGIDRHIKTLDYDIIVYHNNFSEKSKNAINKIHPTQFIDYVFPVEKFNSNESILKFSPLVFSIYECLNLLDKYENVVWLDCDILIQKDFIDAVKQNESISVCFQGDNVGGCMNLKQPISDFNMEARECNSGVVFFNDKLANYNDLYNWCYSTTFKYFDLFLTPDQTVLSIMFDEFKIPVNSLSNMYNCMPFDKRVNNSFIVHTPSNIKFWTSWNFSEWEKNNKIWESLIEQKIPVKRDSFFVRFMRNVGKSKYNILKRPRKFFLSIFNNNLNYY